MEAFEKLIAEVIQKTDLKLTDQEKAKYTEIMIEIFEKGKSPHEVLGFSDEMIEHLYNYGYRLYNNGNYKQAKDVFYSLIHLMPKEARFTLALAASYHRLKDYDNAAKTYFNYGMQEPGNPLPFYYMYDCYYQNGYVGDAEFCLIEVIRRSAEEPAYAKIKERCQLMLDNLRQEIDRLQKEGLLKIDIEEAEKAGVKIDSASIAEINNKKKEQAEVKSS